MSEENQAPESEVVEPVTEEATEQPAAPETDDSAPSTEKSTDEQGDSTDEESESTDDSAKKSQNKVQKRINELTREKYEALREKEALEERLRKLEERTAPREPQKPRMSDFDYDESKFEQAMDNYYRSKLEYETDINSRKSQEQQLQVQKQQEAQEKAIRFSQKVAAEKSQFQDFDAYTNDQTFNAICNAMSQDIVDVIRDSEVSTALTYHLATNLDEAEKLVRMTPVRAAQELVRLEAKLQLPKTKKVSDAPAPIKPIGSTSPSGKDPEKMTIEEWTEWRNAQIKR